VRPARRQAAMAAVIFMVNGEVGLVRWFDRSFELGKMRVDKRLVCGCV